MAGKDTVLGIINLGKGVRKAYNVASSLFRNGEEIALEARKLVPRKAANLKINKMLSEASNISEDLIATQLHASRVTARIRKNAAGNKGLENNLKLRLKYAELKYGRDFENKLIKDLDFSAEDARRYANEEKLKYVNKYLVNLGITPKNLTHTEANSINKAVENSFKIQLQKKIQDIEKLAERYNRMYPTFSPKGAAYIVGGVGGAGLLGGTVYNALTSGTSEEPNLSQSKYRYTSNNGWEKNENGKWNPQQEEFGVDRFGNTNFYDADTGQWYSDYIQGSDGSIYDTQGNLLGNVMPNGGNIFDYNAQQVAQQLGRSSLSPEEIMTIQQSLGVTPDGLIGARTLNAIAQKSGNPLGYFTTYK